MRKGPSRNSPSGEKRVGPKGSGVFSHNPAGTKVAQRFPKARKGDVYHTGELTKANQARAQKRAERRKATATPG